MHKYLVAGVFCFAGGVAVAESPGLPNAFAQCTVLNECLHVLDTVAGKRADGSSSDSDEKYAIRLEKFGLPAKRELLKHALGADRGWRNLSGAILMHWHSFEPADVPVLIAALHKEPGGWIARPLGQIGTREAIEALAEDVRLHGAQNQSGGALSQIGDRVFPYLLPLLSDDRQWRDAAWIMRDMKTKAADGLDTWLAIALDPARPERDRVGALRGVGILGSTAKMVAPKIRPLLSANDSDGMIYETAKKVLAAMGDETMASETVSACAPSTYPFEESFDSTMCLERAAAYGDAVLPYANPILTTFTNSRTGADRASGASFLGYIGYGPARQRLLELLQDSDWRVVYAAARSLGWLGAREAIPDLTAVARTHWLGDVRNEAANVISDLRSSDGSTSRPAARDGTLDFPPDVRFDIDATYAPDVAPCKSGRWTWNGREFREPDDASVTLHIDASEVLPGGTLIGRDSGEWGGEVRWESASGKPLIVVEGNVEGIQPSRDGAVAVIGSGGAWTDYYDERGNPRANEPAGFTISNGPGGSGYALALRRDAGGAWRVEEIARFPRAAFGLNSIGRNLYVAWSGNRAVVFTPAGIAGVAQCVAPN
jgi:HEAT repeat protein